MKLFFCEIQKLLCLFILHLADYKAEFLNHQLRVLRTDLVIKHKADKSPISATRFDDDSLSILIDNICLHLLIGDLSEPFGERCLVYSLVY